MLRALLLLLLLWFCPHRVWADDDFCGPSTVGHVCSMHPGQVCQCQHHELCASLAAERSGHLTLTSRALEIACPIGHKPVPQPGGAVVAAQPAVAILFPMCPCLAPEPPPPRA